MENNELYYKKKSHFTELLMSVMNDKTNKSDKSNKSDKYSDEEFELDLKKWIYGTKNISSYSDEEFESDLKKWIYGTKNSNPYTNGQFQSNLSNITDEMTKVKIYQDCNDNKKN
jgi:hypothetical protein